jgi:hypothetical protein
VGKDLDRRPPISDLANLHDGKFAGQHNHLDAKRPAGDAAAR